MGRNAVDRRLGAGLLGLAAVATLSVGASAHGAVSQTGLIKVRFGGDQLTTRIVVELSRSAQAKLISEGQPLVLDLPRIDVGAEREGRGQGLVRAWSADTGAGAARLKLDLTKPAEIERRFLLAPADGVPFYRYVIDLKAKGATVPSAKTAAVTITARSTGEAIAIAASAPVTKVAAPAVSLKKVIVIDAGHGGRDPGARGEERQEKDVTLAAARALKSRLEKSGRYKIIMTRDSDVYVPLESRMQIARRAGADLFISLHADAGANPATRGASIYTLSDKGSERVQRNASANNGLFKLNLPTTDRATKQILLDLTQRATRNRSAVFAESLLNEIGDDLPLLGRTHRDENFFVLLAPDVPAVLLEMGFITNPEDEKRLADPAARARLAESASRAIDAFFNEEVRLATR